MNTIFSAYSEFFFPVVTFIIMTDICGRKEFECIELLILLLVLMNDIPLQANFLLALFFHTCILFITWRRYHLSKDLCKVCTSCYEVSISF